MELGELSPYSHISARPCPVCGKHFRNFERHTRGKEDHKKLRSLQEKFFREMTVEVSSLHSEATKDSGIVTWLSQTAWDKAIEEIKLGDQTA